MPTRRTRDRSPSSPSSSSEEEEDYKVVTKKKQKTTKPSREEEEEETTSGTEPFRKDFYNAVYTTVKTIPEGKVTAYGTIARLVGYPRHSRMVGAALKCLPRSMANPYLIPAPRSNSGDSTTSVSTTTTATTATTTTTTDIFDYLNNDPFPATSDPSAQDLFNFDFPSLPRLEPEAELEAELEAEPEPLPNPDVVPWWRVLSSTGVISPRGNDRAVRLQADYLIAEGVEVKDGPRANNNNNSGIGGGGVDAFGLGGISGGRVSMNVYGWKG